MRMYCKRGHPFAGSNLGWTKAGTRYCKACKSAWERQRREIEKRGARATRAIQAAPGEQPVWVRCPTIPNPPKLYWPPRMQSLILARKHANRRARFYAHLIGWVGYSEDDIANRPGETRETVRRALMTGCPPFVEPSTPKIFDFVRRATHFARAAA